MKTTQKGFTLIELLIVIAIISLLATTLLPSLNNTRAKGDDARRKVTLKSLQSQIALQTDTGVSGYSNIFSTSGDTKAKLDELVAQTGLTTTDYDAISDATSYAVVFPLKADPTKYWCIDATGVSKEVSGRLNTSGTPGCGNIVGVSNSPVITMQTGYINIGDDGAGVMEMWCAPYGSGATNTTYTMCIGQPDDGYYLPEDLLLGVTATDNQDGNLTSNLNNPFSNGNGYYLDETFSFNPSDANVQAAFPGFTFAFCNDAYAYGLAVKDSNNNITEAYRVLVQCGTVTP